MDPTQRKIMLFMPLFFVLFVINFPAGVIVYWITTNSWTILQQYVVKSGSARCGRRRRDRTVPPPPAWSPPGRGSTRRRATVGAQARSRADRQRLGGSWAGWDGRLLRGPAQGRGAAAVGRRRRRPRGAPRRSPPRKKKKRSGRRR